MGEWVGGCACVCVCVCTSANSCMCACLCVCASLGACLCAVMTSISSYFVTVHSTTVKFTVSNKHSLFHQFACSSDADPRREHRRIRGLQYNDTYGTRCHSSCQRFLQL